MLILVDRSMSTYNITTATFWSTCLLRNFLLDSLVKSICMPLSRVCLTLAAAGERLRSDGISSIAASPVDESGGNKRPHKLHVTRNFRNSLPTNYFFARASIPPMMLSIGPIKKPPIPKSPTMPEISIAMPHAPELSGFL